MSLLTNIEQHSGEPLKFLKPSILEFKLASNQQKVGSGFQGGLGAAYPTHA